MAKLFDAEGNEVEAFTPEELEAKQKEAVDKYIAENPSKNEEYESAKKELDDAKKKLEEYEKNNEGNDEQKKRLKNEKKEAEDAVKNLQENFKKEISELKEGIMKGHREKMLDTLSNGDPELRKKIEYEYDEYSKGKDTPVDEIEVKDRMAKAATLAMGQAPTPGLLDGISSAGQKGEESYGGAKNQEPETENSKAIRKVLGITDKDVEVTKPEINSNNQ